MPTTKLINFTYNLRAFKRQQHQQQNIHETTKQTIGCLLPIKKERNRKKERESFLIKKVCKNHKRECNIE